MEQIEKGYKQTEIGLIPKDWELKHFEDVMEGFSSGQTPYRGNKEYYTGNIPWITSGELNYNIIKDTIEKITSDGVKAANLKIIPKGTFLFAITGLEAEGTRGSCAITGIEATTNQSCMALYPKKGKLTTAYLYHYYVRYGNELALQYCQGTKQQSYTGGIARKLPIILPPTVEEQTAIATALSEADSYIQSLEQVIEKKRLIKKGAMQELLTGKKRLKGFEGTSKYKQTEIGAIPEDWVVKKINNLGIFLKGKGIKKSDVLVEGIACVRYGELYTNHHDFVKKIYSFINEEIAKSSLKLSKGDILFAGSGETKEEIGKCVAFLGEAETYAGGDIVILRPKNINSLFLGFLFNTPPIAKQKAQNGQGDTVVHIYSSGLGKIIIPLPPTMEEQTLIATILSNIDNELEILEQKLEKAKQIKQGMMQQLLTGKIRLV